MEVRWSFRQLLPSFYEDVLGGLWYNQGQGSSMEQRKDIGVCLCLRIKRGLLLLYDERAVGF